MFYTLKTDFVYKEEVSDDHYATLMETHIDKIFKSILRYVRTSIGIDCETILLSDASESLVIKVLPSCLGAVLTESFKFCQK